MSENNSNFQNDIREILDTLYDGFNKGRLFSELTYEQYPKSTIDYLKDKQYIKSELQYGGGGTYNLTPKGIDYIQNNYTEPSMTSGSNNIIVTGSNNVISDNFNHIFTYIEQSDIDAEFKTEIITFLKDLQKSKNDKETTINKIKTFVTGIISSATKAVAVEQLTTFIALLISKFIL